MPPTLHTDIIDILRTATKKCIVELLEYAAREFWLALKRLLAQTASAESIHRSNSLRQDTEPDFEEITREEFEKVIRELVSHC